jgi:hypothetical protein
VSMTSTINVFQNYKKTRVYIRVYFVSTAMACLLKKRRNEYDKIINLEHSLLLNNILCVINFIGKRSSWIINER